jgi:hypothetical protein
MPAEESTYGTLCGLKAATAATTTPTTNGLSGSSHEAELRLRNDG